MDLGYQQARLALEYDRRQHAEDTAQWNHDLNRRAWLDQNDWRLIVVTARGLFRTPGETLDEIRDALRSRGVPVRSRNRPEWQQHFPEQR